MWLEFPTLSLVKLIPFFLFDCMYSLSFLVFITSYSLFFLISDFPVIEACLKCNSQLYSFSNTPNLTCEWNLMWCHFLSSFFLASYLIDIFFDSYSMLVLIFFGNTLSIIFCILCVSYLLHILLFYSLWLNGMHQIDNKCTPHYLARNHSVKNNGSNGLHIDFISLFRHHHVYRYEVIAIGDKTITLCNSTFQMRHYLMHSRWSWDAFFIWLLLG